MMKFSFQQAFTGGKGVLENTTVAPARVKADVSKEQAEVEKKTDAQTNDQQMQQQKETEQLTELKEKIDSFIQNEGLTAQLKTTLDNQQLRLTISDDTLFASGSAQLKPESRELATVISSLLEQYQDYEVVVTGHTDNVPINTPTFPSNFHLSTDRALNFMVVLLENNDVRESRFSSVGYGEYRPVAENSSSEGRAKNRRVEVSIIRNF
jgi:chemotaxis protein MotB